MACNRPVGFKPHHCRDTRDTVEIRPVKPFNIGKIVGEASRRQKRVICVLPGLKTEREDAAGNQTPSRRREKTFQIAEVDEDVQRYDQIEMFFPFREIEDRSSSISRS